MSRLFYGALVVIRAETFPAVEHQLRIIRAALRNKMQEQLSVAVDSKSFSPMLNFTAGVNTSVAFAHFDFCFPSVRRFQMHDRWSRSFWNLDRRCHRDFARIPIRVSW